jgi:DNA mismatch repair protein MutS2
MNTPGVRSANMGFDEETLAPTYRLEVGWPGKSSGLDIAQRLGMPRDVLDRARRTLSTAHQDVEQFLARLREEQETAERLRLEIEEQRASLAERERAWNESQQKRESERAAELERRLESLWRDFEVQAAARLRDLAARAGKAARVRDPRQEAARISSNLRKDAREELRTTLLGHWSAGEPAPPGASPETKVPLDPQPGDRVTLRSFGRQGLVRSRSGHWLEVEVGQLRTKVRVDDIAEVLAAAAPGQATGQAASPPKISVHVERAEQSGSALEINVIGETADEALRRVDKFLDNAFLAQTARVRVVHGSGKGILRKVLAEFFAEHPHVEKFFQAPQNEGGGGATIVELKV